MVFYTKNLFIRPWKIQDAKNLFLQAKNPKIGKNAGWLPHKNIKESEEIIQYVFSQENTYAICLKETDVAIGSISLMIGKYSNLNLSEKEGEIGYWIGEDYWGKGLMVQAVQAILKDGFERLQLDRIWAGHFEGNLQSKRVIEKSGFTFIKVEQNVYWKITKEIKTEYIYCLIKENWKDKEIFTIN